MAEEFDQISHISHVHIEGYKSIDNLEIDLLPGLNILIGKNGSGKSNFLDALTKILYPENDLRIKSGEIKLQTSSSKKVDWHIILPKSERKINEFGQINFEEILHINDSKIYDQQVYPDNIYKMKSGGQMNLRFFPNHLRILLTDEKISPPVLTKVGFSLPSNLAFIATPGFFQLDDSGLERADSFLFEVFDIPHRITWNKEINKEDILNSFYIEPNRKKALKKYSPITDIRWGENINIFKDEKRTRIDNIQLEFKINKNWIPWSFLSDGTKRLFYLISQITDYNSGIFLIEEPELGVHPHQFLEIMTFLKDESKNKQIIIATHSPEAINILNHDELDRIIITKYSPKKGTQMKHLTAVQKKNAISYATEVGYLSDYWIYSDLEK